MRIVNLYIIILSLSIVSACTSMHPVVQIEKAEGFPQAEGFVQGVSAMYVARLGNQLILAGGCNFPNEPVYEGGKKVFYQDIYATSVDMRPFHWERVGALPHPMAYGATVCTDTSVICIAGSTPTALSAQVFCIRLVENEVQIDTLPSLPEGRANHAAVLIDDEIYVVGGNTQNGATNDLLVLDLDYLAAGWQLLAPFPDGPRTQLVAVAADAQLYLFGGFAAMGGAVAAPSLSTSSWRYTPKNNSWTSVASPTDASGTPISLGGGVASVWNERYILCTAGVHKDIFLQALQREQQYKQAVSLVNTMQADSLSKESNEYLRHEPTWYQFNGLLLCYDTLEDVWSVIGEYPQGAKAGAGIVSTSDGFYLVNGEIKPGVRTPDIWKYTINK